MQPAAQYQVLILSDGNAGRSLIAEHLLRHRSQGLFEVRSAGMTPAPALNHLARQILEDRYALALPHQRPQSWQNVTRFEFDLIITLTEAARANRVSWRGHPLRAHWGTPNPGSLAEAGEELYQAWVDVAEQISARVNVLAAQPQSHWAETALALGQRFAIEEGPALTSVAQDTRVIWA